MIMSKRKLNALKCVGCALVLCGLVAEPLWLGIIMIIIGAGIWGWCE